MRIAKTLGRLGVMSLLLGSVGVVTGGERGVAAQTPKAVTQAVTDAFPGASITSAKPEKEEIDQYEVEFTSRGKAMSADVAPDGTIIATNEPVEEADVPAAARASVHKAADGAKIKGYEKVTVRAKTDKAKNAAVKLSIPQVQYEADLSKGGMSAEVAVDADGKVIEAPEWKKEEAESK